jgi:lipopolysaccharide O-acetyltransferase
MKKRIEGNGDVMKARRFIQVNGLYLFACELGRRAGIFFRRCMVAGKLGCPDIALGPRSHLRGLACMHIGKNFHTGEGLWIEALTSYQGQVFFPRIIIGDNVSISRWSHISAIDYIEIGARTLVGSNVIITDHNHGFYRGCKQSSPGVAPALRTLGGGGPVIIGENVWIGDNVTIIGPVNVGDGAILGANAVVNRDVMPETIVGGIPARPLKGFVSSSNSWETL